MDSDRFESKDDATPFEFDLSASLFSSVPKSVLPLSSSDSKPDRRSNDSIRPSRFSSPSIYFALRTRMSHLSRVEAGDIPFGWVSFLLDLSKYAFGFVIDAVCTRWHFAVTLDLLFSTHVTRLLQVSFGKPSLTPSRGVGMDIITHPCNPSPLGLIALATIIRIHQIRVLAEIGSSNC
jgi:hypothetical protein